MISIYETGSIVNEHTKECKTSVEFIESVLNENLFPIIDKWKGLNVWRIKKPLNKFKDYFAKGRNWWDINKQKITGSSLWIPVSYIGARKTCPYFSSSVYVYIYIITRIVKDTKMILY